jgi:hypothetical protein
MLAAAIDPYKTGVLVPEVHERLVLDIENIARDASIQPIHIMTPLAKAVTAKEVDWVRGFKRHPSEGVSGLCYVGKKPKQPIEDRMAAIAGALVRNFVRARIFTVGQMMEFLEDKRGSVPEASCLLIPNFFIEKAMAGQTSSWKIPPLLDLLLDRHLTGKQTVIYASSMEALAAEYGAAFEAHVNAHYTIVTV